MKTKIKYFVQGGSATVGVRTFVEEHGIEMYQIDAPAVDYGASPIGGSRSEYEDFLTTTWKGVEVKRCKYFKTLGVKPS